MDPDYARTVAADDYHPLCSAAERYLRESISNNWSYAVEKVFHVDRPHINDPEGLLRSLDSMRSGSGMRSSYS